MERRGHAFCARLLTTSKFNNVSRSKLQSKAKAAAKKKPQPKAKAAAKKTGCLKKGP